LITIKILKTAADRLKNNVLAIKLFFIIASSIAGAALLISVGATMVFLALDEGGKPPVANNKVIIDFEKFAEEGYLALPERVVEENAEEDHGLVAARTNFILAGIDNFQLADAIMLGTFYRDNGKIHLMSVPRDTLVRIPPHRIEKMREDGIRPPRTLKINELRSYGGQVHGIYYLQEQIEEMLGITIDFYVEVQLEGFRRVVDAIGGVEMYIPRRLWYVDPCQNLRIDVPAGNVRLDGNMAEGVVRFRQYPMGDLQRNQMQMEFMTQLIKQAATREAILNDPMELIRTINDNVRSDIGLGAVMFIPYIPRLSLDSVQTFTMPGAVGTVDGRGFFIPDASKLPDTINDVFYNTFEEPEEEEPEEEE